MTFALLCIFITILWIVLGTSLAKLHPFLVLFSAALLLAVLLGLPLMESLNLIQSGFGQIVQKIGLL
ncbi:MAG: GntP family permease, partial [Flavobacteriaceae bacterium]